MRFARCRRRRDADASGERLKSRFQMYVPSRRTPSACTSRMPRASAASQNFERPFHWPRRTSFLSSRTIRTARSAWRRISISRRRRRTSASSSRGGCTDRSKGSGIAAATVRHMAGEPGLLLGAGATGPRHYVERRVHERTQRGHRNGRAQQSMMARLVSDRCRRASMNVITSMERWVWSS